MVNKKMGNNKERQLFQAIGDPGVKAEVLFQ
jgi:hypothetical protein